MATTIGVLGLMAAGCGPCSAAEPPPPYVPAYRADEALAKLRRNPCAGALAGAEVSAVGLRGYQGADGPVVILDVEVAPPPSPLGVRYRARTSLGLAPATGEVRDGSACTADLRVLLDALSRAVAAAEASPEVARFVAEHAPADRIQATFEAWAPPRGRLTWVATGADGTRVIHVWE
jgi:hypothetical protein